MKSKRASVRKSPPRRATKRKPPARRRTQPLSHTTIDHEEIRHWAEKRGAHPAAVKRTESKKDVGIIRLDFPDFSGGDSLEEIGWDEFFDKFDKSKLALVYQERTARGQRSNFNKLVKRR